MGTIKPQARCNLAFLFISFCVVTLFSKSSFLYYTNDWMDVNAYFTVGKSMLNGLVPYRDVFDHKGPVLFFVHCIAAIISFKSFLGVYLLELLACYALLKVNEKILRLFPAPKSCIAGIAISMIVVYSSFSFQKGDSVEELSLPLLAYCLYVVIRFVKELRMPGKVPSITLGVCVGLVFWMKFNLLGMFFGLVPYALIVSYREKVSAAFWCMILWAFVGFFMISLIVLSYFFFNGSVMDLIDGYFITNICNYHQGPTMHSILYYYYVNTKIFIEHNVFYVIFLLVVLKGFHRDSRYCRNALILSVTFLFLFLYFTIAYPYYSLIFAIFIPWGAYELQILIDKYRHSRVLVMCIGVLCAVCTLSNRNILSLYLNQDDSIRTLNETISNRGKGSILNYHTMDWGLGTLTGSIPNVRYFYRPNTGNAPMIESEQDRYLKEGTVDYIISTIEIPEDSQYELLDVVDFMSLKGLVKNKIHKPVGMTEITTLYLYGKPRFMTKNGNNCFSVDSNWNLICRQ